MKRAFPHLIPRYWESQAALVTYLCAGDPDFSTSLRMFTALQQANVDLIEVGIPFSDPGADGETIQAASQRALQSGQTVRRSLELIGHLWRQAPSIPIVAMTYLNPIWAYGLRRFFSDAAQAGVSGIIVVDLPWEEQNPVLEHCAKSGIALVQLLAPNTPPNRRASILERAQGMVYHIAVRGVTGKQTANMEDLGQSLRSVRTMTDVPVVTGFGIQSVEDIRNVARESDGVVLGSSLIRVVQEALLQHPADHESAAMAVTKIVKKWRQAAHNQDGVE